MSGNRKLGDAAIGGIFAVIGVFLGVGLTFGTQIVQQRLEKSERASEQIKSAYGDLLSAAMAMQNKRATTIKLTRLKLNMSPDAQADLLFSYDAAYQAWQAAFNQIDLVETDLARTMLIKMLGAAMASPYDPPKGNADDAEWDAYFAKQSARDLKIHTMMYSIFLSAIYSGSSRDPLPNDANLGGIYVLMRDAINNGRQPTESQVREAAKSLEAVLKK
jgi:hypothetical protein